MTTRQTIALGGGCHWCTEAVFQALRGVRHIRQGFARATPPADTWSEAITLEFAPQHIPLLTLLEIHLRTHASTAAHKMRGKYRSAVYTTSPEQAAEVRTSLNALAPGFEAPLVTSVLPLSDFKSSDPRFHNYYATDPARPFCKTYIDPKLQKLRQDFASHLKSGV